MKYLFILIQSVLIVSCIKYSGDNKNINKNHIWKKKVIYYYLNKKENNQTETAVKKAFDNWSRKTHFKFIYKGRHYAGIKKDGKNTVSFLIKWPENLPQDKIAWCTTWYDSSGYIIESDIIFNMTITKFTTVITNTPDSYYIEGVLSHERGHLIGLDHIDLKDSVMKQKSDVNESFFKDNEPDSITLKAYRELYKIK